jgi:hypothetical protein
MASHRIIISHERRPSFLQAYNRELHCLDVPEATQIIPRKVSKFFLEKCSEFLYRPPGENDFRTHEDDSKVTLSSTSSQHLKSKKYFRTIARTKLRRFLLPVCVRGGFARGLITIPVEHKAKPSTATKRRNLLTNNSYRHLN